MTFFENYSQNLEFRTKAVIAEVLSDNEGSYGYVFDMFCKLRNHAHDRLIDTHSELWANALNDLEGAVNESYSIFMDTL